MASFKSSWNFKYSTLLFVIIFTICNNIHYVYLSYSTLHYYSTITPRHPRYLQRCNESNIIQILHIFNTGFCIYVIKIIFCFVNFRGYLIWCKVENFSKGSLDSIPSPSPSVKIQIMSRKICLRCKGKILLGIVNKPMKTKCWHHPAMFCLTLTSLIKG